MLTEQTTGIINIGTKINRTGAINIGTNMQETITIGNSGGQVNINGTGTIKASSFDTGSVGVGVSLYTSTTSGSFTMLTSQTTGTINIATNASRSGVINIGSASCALNITGTGTIKASKFDATVEGSNVTLFETIGSGDITFAGNQTGGDLIIGNKSTRTGTITIGATTCATNITGTGTIKANAFDVVNNSTAVTLFGTTTTGTCTILNNQTGVLNFANGTRSGNINFGTNCTGTITIGNTGGTVNINGIGTIKANNFDVVGSGTSVKLFDTTTTGSISIGVKQTTAALNIGTLSTRTGDINIGANTCATNITGTGDIKANNFDVVGTSTAVTLFDSTLNGVIDIGTNQTGGGLYIGTSPSRTADISIGSNATGGVLRLGSVGTATTTIAGVIGNINFTGLTNICTSQTGSILNIATSANRTAELNINNNNTSTNNINIGNILTTTNITGIGTIKANTYDIVGSASTVSLFDTTTTGSTDFFINQTSGELNIATKSGRTGALNINNNNSASNTISIGSPLTTTNINGIGTIKAVDFDAVNSGTDVTLFKTLGDGDITIGGAQTTGVMNIGTGVRPATGIINIGNNSNALNLCPINIGAFGTPTTLGGSVTINRALTLPSINIAPSTAQLGYTLGTTGGPSAAITTATSLIATTNIAIGIYILTFDVNVDTITSGVNTTLTFTFPITGGCTITHTTASLGGITNGQSTGGSYTGVLKCSTATNSCTLTMACSAGSAIARTYKSTILRIS